ncbi:MAG TPA: sensor histidine kinase [Dehalococcoidales bacterium]|nr:sensor histidine kinase [Dehalococcoidales bacterium]
MKIPKLTIRPWQHQIGRVLLSPHFWANILLVALISVFYYQVHIFGYRLTDFYWNIQTLEFRYNAIGSLYLVPLIYAALVFWWRGALIVWCASLVIILPQILTFRQDPVYHFINIIYSLMPLLVVILISLILTWRNKERQVLAERENERQNYISQVFKAQEDERRRLSQEIHDDSLQKMAGVATLANMLAQDSLLEQSPRAREMAESVKNTIISISQDLRKMCIGLRPTVLDDLGLVPAIYWLVDGFKQESRMGIQVSINGETREVSKKITVLVFRIVQEALNNARNHSRATSVSVNLTFRDNSILASVTDNGRGFQGPFNYDELVSQGKLGLIGMQQRTQALNGRINIQSSIGQGTSITLEVET